MNFIYNYIFINYINIILSPNSSNRKLNTNEKHKMMYKKRYTTKSNVFYKSKTKYDSYHPSCGQLPFFDITGSNSKKFI